MPIRLASTGRRSCRPTFPSTWSCWKTARELPIPPTAADRGRRAHRRAAAQAAERRRRARRDGCRWARSSAPARATREATPTSASGPATTTATPGSQSFLTVDELQAADARSRRAGNPPLRAAESEGAQLRRRRPAGRRRRLVASASTRRPRAWASTCARAWSSCRSRCSLPPHLKTPAAEPLP